MKTVLITGGAGFIGSHLVDRLLAEREWKVVVLDDFNNFYSPVLKYHNVARHTDDPSFTLVGADILSAAVLEGIFSDHKFDCVVHLADRLQIGNSVEDPHLFDRTNIHGTLNVLEAARNFKVKQFIFGSTAAVYGNNLQTPFSEDAPITDLISPFAETKAAGERLCRTYTQLYGLRCICLRFFTVYGPRQRPGTAVYKFMRQIDSGRPVTIYGSGKREQDYVHISDVIAGIRAALDYDSSNFEIINLGSGQAVKLFDLVRSIENALGQNAVVEEHQLPKRTLLDSLADIGKARRLLGYGPKVRIDAGIDNFVRWYKSDQHLPEPNVFANEAREQLHASDGF
jgi:UDP-glucuronate 4-epimerase